MDVSNLLCPGYTSEWHSHAQHTSLVAGVSWDGCRQLSEPLAMSLPVIPFSPAQAMQVTLSEMIMDTAFNLSLCIRKVNHPHCLVFSQLTVPWVSKL